MATRNKNDTKPAEKLVVNTARLEALAAEAAQGKQWRARKTGLRAEEEPAEVRNLSQDAEARKQAEAAMQQMMTKSAGKPRRR